MPRVWLIASIALAAPGATLPLVELLQWLYGVAGISTVPLAQPHNTAEAVAYESLVFTVLSFLAAVMATEAVRRGRRWVIWIPPIVALFGSLSFWLRMLALAIGS